MCRLITAVVALLLILVPLSGNVVSNKDTALGYQPLLLAEFVFGDASVLRLSTHPLNVAEGGFQYGGNDYLARIEKQDIAQVAAVSETGIDIPASVTLRLADADQYLFLNYEKAAGKGFKGAALTLRVILWEADTANFSSDSLIPFKGRCDQPGFNVQSGELTVKATSLANMQRSMFPVVPIQPRCAWVFPRTKPERIDAAVKRDSRWYECGYSPDILDADVAGGAAAARGNYESGSTPFTACDYTREACIARLGDASRVAPFTTGNPPPIEKDTSNRLTGRFSGIRFVPPNTWRGKGYESGKQESGQNSAREEKYQEFVPMVWGTAWVDAPVMQVMGEPNSTRGEIVVCSGEVDDIRLLILNDVRIDQSSDIAGNPYIVGDKLLRWDVVNRGDRDGHVNLDAIYDGNGDPYGSICALAYVVHKSIASSGSAPHVRVLVRGPKIHTPDTSNAADYATWPRAYTENPAYQLLDILTYCDWLYTDLDIGSFRDVAALCDPTVTYSSLTGSSLTHPRFSSSFAISKRKAAKDIVTALLRSFNCLLLHDPSTGLLKLAIKSTLAIQQPAPVTGSNYDTAISSKNYAGTATNGYAAYSFDESSIVPGSLELIERSTTSTPNRVSVTLNDQEREYAESRYTRVDTEDVSRTAQEVQASIEMLGLQNFDQSQRILATAEAEDLRGNPQNDTRGTWRFKFTTSVKAVHLRLGHLCRFSWQAWAISNQLVRIEQIKPDKNWETATLVVAWHIDDWYLDSYGQFADTAYSDMRRNRLERPSLAWCPAMEAPITGDSVVDASELTFQMQPEYATAADGTAIAKLLITGKLPVNDFGPMKAPLTVTQGTTASTGGSLAGGDVYYLAVCARDADDNLSAPSDPVTAVQVPSGTATNTATIAVTKWPAGATGYALFAGRDPNKLSWQVDVAATPSSITLASMLERNYGMPDVEFDRFLVRVKRSIHSGVLGNALSAVATGELETLGSTWTTDQFAGYDVTVIGKANQGAVIPVANFSIVSNTADTLTVTPDPVAAGIEVGDVIVIRSKPTVGSDAGGNYLLDANWVNSGGSGLTVDAEIGNMVRVIAGPGRGYTYRIKSNTATKVYIEGDWIITPTSASRYIIEEPVFQDALTAGPFNNGDGGAEVTLTPEVTNYSLQSLLVQVLTLDGIGTPSLEFSSPVREIYLFGSAGEIGEFGLIQVTEVN